MRDNPQHEAVRAWFDAGGDLVADAYLAAFVLEHGCSPAQEQVPGSPIRVTPPWPAGSTAAPAAPESADGPWAAHRGWQALALRPLPQGQGSFRPAPAKMPAISSA